MFKEVNMDTKDMQTITYNIKIQSPFILTQNMIKQKLGFGFQLLALVKDSDIQLRPITDVDSAVNQIVQLGYRALARAHHPDLGGNPEVMMILNRAKKELSDVLNSIGIEGIEGENKNGNK